MLCCILNGRVHKLALLLARAFDANKPIAVYGKIPDQLWLQAPATLERLLAGDRFAKIQRKSSHLSQAYT